MQSGRSRRPTARRATTPAWQRYVKEVEAAAAAGAPRCGDASAGRMHQLFRYGPQVERALREIAEARGIPVPAVAADSGVRIAAGIGRAGTIAVRHASCEEAPELLAAHEPPVLLVNGRVVISGAGWGEAEVRAAIQRAIKA